MPDKPRTYYTVFYTCDSSIENTETLLRRLCTDSDPDDGLLRLVPDKGKQLQEFSRSSEEGIHLDLKLLNWGETGSNAEKYSNAITADIYQTFRNFCSSILEFNNRFWRRRDGVIIFLDEFDVIKNKTGFGSMVKSMTSERLKFAISGISDDLDELIEDHGSIGRLI